MSHNRTDDRREGSLHADPEDDCGTQSSLQNAPRIDHRHCLCALSFYFLHLQICWTVTADNFQSHHHLLQSLPVLLPGHPHLPGVEVLEEGGHQVGLPVQDDLLLLHLLLHHVPQDVDEEGAGEIKVRSGWRAGSRQEGNIWLAWKYHIAHPAEGRN